MSETRYSIGVDLGTTHCALSYVDLQASEGEVVRLELCPIPQLSAPGSVEERPLLPSFLYLPHPDELAPGDAAAVQVRLDTPVTLVKEDRYVIRSYSPVRTIGGGQILNPIPTKHKRFRTDISEALNALAEMPPEDVIGFHARQAGFRGTEHNELRLVTNLPDKKLDTAISALLSRRDLIMIDRERRLYVHADTYAYLRQMVLDQLAAYHAKNPLKAGMPREELRSKFPTAIHPKLPPQVLNQMLKGQELSAEEDTIRLASHKVSLAGDQSLLKEKILKAYVRGGITPPYFKDVCKSLEVAPREARDVLQLLVEVALTEDEELKARVPLFQFLRRLEQEAGPVERHLRASGVELLRELGRREPFQV